MQAVQALRSGNLDLALEEVKSAVKKHPADAKHRIFLFQLFAVMGQWDKASDQLKSAGLLDAGVLALAAIYGAAMACEGQRNAVFNGSQSPIVVGEPEPWLALLIEAMKQSGQGQDEAAAKLREQAFAMAPASPCNVDGQDCAWLADADSRLGPVLEMIVNGEYRWVPFTRLRSITLEPPSDLRDLIWMPATCTWSNGGVTAALIPSRYHCTESSTDTQLLLSRRTDWLALAADEYKGMGQRQLVADQGEFALLDLRRIVFEPTASSES